MTKQCARASELFAWNEAPDFLVRPDALFDLAHTARERLADGGFSREKKEGTASLSLFLKHARRETRGSLYSFPFLFSTLGQKNPTLPVLLLLLLLLLLLEKRRVFSGEGAVPRVRGAVAEYFGERWTALQGAGWVLEGLSDLAQSGETWTELTPQELVADPLGALSLRNPTSERSEKRRDAEAEQRRLDFLNGRDVLGKIHD